MRLCIRESKYVYCAYIVIWLIYGAETVFQLAMKYITRHKRIKAKTSLELYICTSTLRINYLSSYGNTLSTYGDIRVLWHFIVINHYLHEEVTSRISLDFALTLRQIDLLSYTHFTSHTIRTDYFLATCVCFFSSKSFGNAYLLFGRCDVFESSMG